MLRLDANFTRRARSHPKRGKEMETIEHLSAVHRPLCLSVLSILSAPLFRADLQPTPAAVSRATFRVRATNSGTKVFG